MDFPETVLYERSEVPNCDSGIEGKNEKIKNGRDYAVSCELFAGASTSSSVMGSNSYDNILNQEKETKAESSIPSLLPLDFSVGILRSDLFEPILAVHSNAFVEERREDIRNIARRFNTMGSVISAEYPTLSRPAWPFLPWNQSAIRPKLDPDAFLSEIDHTFDPHKHRKQLSTNILGSVLEVDESRVNFDFVDFVFKSAEESFRVELSPEYEKIVSDVRLMVKQSCDGMEKRHKIFQGYSLIETGSMVEGTKMGNPDEFDFMVDLPNLNYALEFYTEQKYFRNEEKRTVRIKNREMLSDFKGISEELITEKDDKALMCDIWSEILVEFANTIKANVSPGWMWLDVVHPSMTTLAQTQKLLWKGDKYTSLVVHIDVCICVKPPNFDSRIDFNQEAFDRTRPGITDEQLERKEQKSSNVFLILRSDGEARWTRAVLEKEIWAMFPQESGRKRVYRCLKYFIMKFLSNHYNSALFRLDPAIPSYWMKTILFYIMTWYHEDRYWKSSFLTLRFVESWFMLKNCMNRKCLSSFFVPDNVMSKLCPLYVNENEDYKKILSDVNKLSEFFSKSDEKNERTYSDLLKEVELRNCNEVEKGIFNSVIELCYFYAYNEFADENKKALISFLTVFGNGQFVLEGEGKTLKLKYKGNIVDINYQIEEQYGDKNSYFS